MEIDRRRWLLRVFPLLALLALQAAPAGAQNDEAVDHYRRGVQAFTSANYAVACTEFDASFKLLRHPQTAYFLSNAYLKQLDKTRAKHWAKEALKPTPPYILDQKYVEGANEIIQWADWKPAPAKPTQPGIGVSAQAITQPPSPPVPGSPLLENGAADGQTAKRCRAYGATAVAQQRINTDNQCGLTGGRWNPDYPYHEQWCASQTAAVIRSETMSRQGLLEGCAATAEKRCAVYAATAVAQEKVNQDLHCGLSGGQWSGDYDYHYRWCLAVSPDMLRGETSARRERLDACAP